ncbi:MAG: hypothetical protein PHI19_07395 [Clostridia bacterium]|nr:hypothetical protein [Clostridia bacterium]
MRIFLLLKGEFIRLYKYKVLVISLAVTALWMLIAGLLSKEEALTVAPLLILSDITMMTSLLLAASCYFEKQEGTLITTMIAPVKVSEVLTAKIAAYTLFGMLSGFLISLILIIVHGISVQVGLLLLYSALIGINSCALGYLLMMISKDFNSMLINLMAIILILLVPSILFYLGLIADWTKYLLFLSPYHTAFLMANSTVAQASVSDI